MMNTRRDPHTALKAGSRTMTGSIARRRLGNILMALQIALAMVLVSGAGLMLRSFLDVQKVDLGYQPQRLFLSTSMFPRNRMLKLRSSIKKLWRVFVPYQVSRMQAASMPCLATTFPTTLLMCEGHQNSQPETKPRPVART